MARSKYSDAKKWEIVQEAMDKGYRKTSKKYQCSPSTIRRWKRRFGITQARPQKRGSGRSRRRAGTGGSASHDPHQGAGATPPPPLTNRQFHEAMDRSAAAFAAKKRRWFATGRRQEKALQKLDGIVTQWEVAHKRPSPGADGGPLPSSTSQSKPTSQSEESGDRRRQSASHSMHTRKVFVFDLAPVNALAADHPDAWGLLRKIVDGRHEMVVPRAVIEQAKPNMRANALLRSVLRCKYVKRAALSDQDEKTANMLCERVRGADIVQASVIVVASNCIASLRKRCTIGSWSLEVVTDDLEAIRALARINLELLPERFNGAWYFLPLSRRKSRTPSDSIDAALTGWQV